MGIQFKYTGCKVTIILRLDTKSSLCPLNDLSAFPFNTKNDRPFHCHTLEEFGGDHGFEEVGFLQEDKAHVG